MGTDPAHILRPVRVAGRCALVAALAFATVVATPGVALAALPSQPALADGAKRDGEPRGRPTPTPTPAGGETDGHRSKDRTPKPTPTIAPTPTPAPTPTAEPTLAPEPTATPVAVPTSTPVTVVTPAPTTDAALSGSCRITSVVVDSNSKQATLRPGDQIGYTVRWQTSGKCSGASVAWTTDQPGGTFSGTRTGGTSGSTTFTAGPTLGSNWRVTAAVTVKPGSDTKSDSRFVDVKLESSLSAAPASGRAGGTATLSATLTSGGTAVEGRTISFAALGTTITSTTDRSGVASAALAVASTVTPGVYTYTATFGGDASYRASSATAGLTVRAAEVPTVAIVIGDLSPSTVAGTELSFTVTALDANGAVATGYRGTLHVASSDAQASLPSDRTFGATDGGVVTLALTLRSAGTRSITVTDTASATLTASRSVDVAAGAPASVSVSPASATIAAGASASFAASVADAFGNRSGAPIAWSATPGATCTAAGACTAAAVGTYTITAAAGTASATASLAVTAAAVDHVAVTPGAQTITYGGSASFSAKAFDRYENEVAVALAWSSSPAAGCDGAGKCTPAAASAAGYVVSASAAGVTGSATLVVNKASASIGFSGGPFSYDGSPHGPAVSVAPSGVTVVLRYTGTSNAGAAYDATSAPVSAGSYALGATVVDPNYDGTASTSFTIGRATPSVVVTPVSATYDALPHGTTARAFGVGGADLGDAAVSYSTADGGAPVAAGGYTASGTYAGSANYVAATGRASIEIAKARSQTVVSAAPAAYTGAPYRGAAAETTGVGGAVVARPSLTYAREGLALAAAPTDAGSYVAGAAFAGNDNYVPSEGSATFTISKADARVSIAPVSATYDGAAHGTTARAIGLAGVDLGAATVTYGTPDGAAPVNAGAYVATGTFAGNGNYNAAAADTTIEIAKASSFTTVTAPGATYTGAGYAGATAVATTAAGAVLGAPQVSFARDGSPLAGAPIDAGSYVALAEFAGNENYFGSTGGAAFTIAKATPSVSAASVTCTYNGTACAGSGSATGVRGEALAPVSLTYAGGAAPTAAGTSTYTATFAGGANYVAAASAPATIAIAKASALVRATGNVCTYSGAACSGGGSATGGAGEALAVALRYGTADGSAPVNAGAYTVTATTAGDANNSGGSATASILIQPAPGGTVLYTGQQLYVTASNTTYTTTVTSSASVSVPAGDVATARVTFSLDGGATAIPGCASVAVTRTGTGTGTASCQWTATVPSVPGYAIFAATAVLGGNYATATSTKYVLVATPVASKGDHD